MSRPEAWPDEFAGESAHGQEDGAHQQRQRRHLPDFAAAEAAPRQRASYHVVRARQDGHQGAPFMRGLRTVRTALSGQIWCQLFRDLPRPHIMSIKEAAHSRVFGGK
jgi:hypothetical protein